MKRMTSIFIYTIILILTLISTTTYARLRPVKTSCPACYHLASVHNETFRRYQDALHEIEQLTQEIETLDSILETDERTLEHWKQEYIKGTKNAAQTFQGWHKTILEKRKLRAERVNKLQTLKKSAEDYAVLMAEYQKRLRLCEKKECEDKLRYHGGEVDFFVPEVPQYISAACIKCIDAAKEYNDKVDKMKQLVEDIKSYIDGYRKRLAQLQALGSPTTPEKDETLKSLKKLYRVGVEKLHKESSELDVLRQVYRDCVEKECKGKRTTRIPDAQYVGEKDRYTTIGILADIGFANFTGSFKGPFGSGSDSSVADGIGLTAFIQHFFPQAPTFAIFADVSLPADRTATVLDEKTDPASAFNST